MKFFVLWPIFFGIYGKNVSRFFQNRTPGIRMMNCRKSIYNFIKIVFSNVTGNLSSSFLFNWQNLFSRFLAIVSFVSGGTVWDYDFFYWKYKSCWYTFGRWATTFLHMSRFLPPGFSWVYSSCTEEPFHGKDFLSKKKQNISSPPEVERKRFLKIWQKYFTNVVIVWFYVSRRNFCGLFLNKKHWYPLTLIKVFSDFWHFSFATFFRKEFNRSSRRVGGEFFCVLQSPFFMISGKLSKSFSVIRWYLLWIFLESASYVSRATIWGWKVCSEMLKFYDYFPIRSDYSSDISFENIRAGCHNCVLNFQLYNSRRRRLFSKVEKLCHFLRLIGNRIRTLWL